MLEEEYLKISKELPSLKDKREELEAKLDSLNSKEDIIECKYEIIKISEKIQVLENKLKDLGNQIQEKKQSEIEFKESYINLNVHIPIFRRLFNINQLSNDDVIRYVIDNCTKEQISIMDKIFRFLNQSELDALVYEFNNQHSRLGTLLRKYNKKCNHVEKLRPSIKDKINEVEKSFDLKFDGFGASNNMMVLFMKDFSQEIDFESFIVNNFEGYMYSEVEDYLYSIEPNATYRDVEDYLKDMSEYQKLEMVSQSNFYDYYVDHLYEMVYGIIRDDFDFDVYINTPKNTTPIHMQTQEYKYEKDKVYEKNVQKYDELIAKKRNEKKDKSDNFDCIKNLNEDSSIEDIANCYCKCEGFNNWEYDEKNKKIVFKFLRAGGKNYSKMRTVEVKELESWPKNR